LGRGTVTYTAFPQQVLPTRTPALVFDDGAMSLQLPYVTLGNWRSPPVPVDALQWFASGTLAWTQDVPDDTKVFVFFTFDHGHTWHDLSQAASGSYSIDLTRFVAPGEPLDGREASVFVTLNSADETTTPTVSGLTLDLGGFVPAVKWLSGAGRRLRERLYTPIKQSPKAVTAFRLDYDGALEWQVRNGLFTAQVTGGPGDDLRLFLPAMTLGELTDRIAREPGYRVEEFDPADAGLGAVSLIDGDGRLDKLNGGVVSRFTAASWDYTQAVGWEVEQTAAMVPEAIAQLDIDRAAAPWLDKWGSYFNVARYEDETDAQYARRIETYPFRPRCNGFALEQRVADQTGYKVKVRTLGWRDKSRLIRTNAAPVYRHGVKTWPGTTNSADWICGPRDPDAPGLALLTQLGLIVGNETPYWGDPDNGNLLVCAFAVLMGHGLDRAEQRRIFRVIEGSRAAGTVALYFQSPELLLTNTAGDNANGLKEVGPTASTYAQVPRALLAA
jgi:hypothetical protein